MRELQPLFDDLLVLLKDEFGDQLEGVLVTGSRIHGTPGPTSDLDVHVVIATPRRRRRNILLRGIEIEMFINPAFRVPGYFEDGRGNALHMFAFGRVIYDPRGIMASFQSDARARWESGPPPIAANDYAHRYAPADMLRDLEDLGTSDEATANLLIVELVEMLVYSHYRINCRWPEKLKHRLADLERWDAEAAGLARSALASQALAERRAAVEQLAEHVLRPLGGLMPLEWTMEWEELSP